MRLIAKRMAWVCVAVYLYIGFVAYPATRRGGSWDYLDGAPGWVIAVAVACFFGSWILFAVGDGSPKSKVPTDDDLPGDDRHRT